MQCKILAISEKRRKRPIGSNQIKSNTAPGFGLPVSGPRNSNLNLLIVQVARRAARRRIVTELLSNRRDTEKD